MSSDVKVIHTITRSKPKEYRGDCSSKSNVSTGVSIGNLIQIKLHQETSQKIQVPIVLQSKARQEMPYSTQNALSNEESNKIPDVEIIYNKDDIQNKVEQDVTIGLKTDDDVKEVQCMDNSNIDTIQKLDISDKYINENPTNYLYDDADPSYNNELLKTTFKTGEVKHGEIKIHPTSQYKKNVAESPPTNQIELARNSNLKYSLKKSYPYQKPNEKSHMTIITSSLDKSLSIPRKLSTPMSPNINQVESKKNTKSSNGKCKLGSTASSELMMTHDVKFDTPDKTKSLHMKSSQKAPEKQRHFETKRNEQKWEKCDRRKKEVDDTLKKKRKPSQKIWCWEGEPFYKKVYTTVSITEVCVRFSNKLERGLVVWPNIYKIPIQINYIGL